MKRTRHLLIPGLLAAAALVGSGCNLKSKTVPSSPDPAIGLILTPQSGKAPLSVEADIDVKNGSSCKLILIQNGVEGAPNDISCKERLTRVFTANGSIKVTTRGADGRTYTRAEPVTIQ